MIKAIKLIDYFFKFERASFRSSGGRGVDRLLVIGRRDALVTERFRYREFRYRESRVYLNGFLRCEAVLNNFDLPYYNTFNRCAKFLRVVYRDSLKKQKLYT